MHLNEHKVTSLPAAAVMADEFVLTHKTMYQVPVSAPRCPRSPSPPPSPVSVTPNNSREDLECFYCHNRGHIIANCLALKKKKAL